MSVHWVKAGDCDHRTLRTMLGSFMTGVTVVSARSAAGEVRAFTANSFTSVSLEPPLVLICLGKTSRSFDVFSDAASFSINILGDWQRECSSSFASKDLQIKAASIEQLADDDVPYLANSLSSLVCERHQVVDAGDHVILIGRVTRFLSTEGQPLGFYRGSYATLAQCAGVRVERHPQIRLGVVTQGR